MPASPKSTSIGIGVAELGRYRLCAELAAGGMGSVYLASGQSGGFNKIVALKRIHGHLARDPKFVEMFLDEARVAARITHPNVCSVFDFGEIGGTYFIAMEYLMGETFSSIHRALRDRDRSEWVHHLAEIFAQAAEGLHAAHELCGDDGESLGVVHRDVSPQNLFLTYDGCAKVVDFGVARCAGRVLQTEPGTIKGKLAYVAPEQLRCHEIDRRSDVWALGVTLWEMLAGRTLFRRGNDIETLQAVVSDEIPPPTEMDPELPPELDAIVLRALSRDLDDRYPTARELSRALREFNRAKMAIVGQVELEEWMAELFPVQRREKQAMVQAARESSVIREPKSEASGREPTHTIVHHGPPEHMPLDHSRVSMPRAFWAGIGVSAAIAVALGGWIVAFTRPWPSEIDPVASSALEPGPLAGTITPHAEPREAELAPRPRRVPEEDRPAARDVTRAARDEAREESSERSRGRRGRPAVRELASAARAASTPRRERDSEPTDAGHATTDSGPSSAPDAATASAPVLVAEAPAPAEIARPVSTPTPAASAAPERSAPPVAPAPSPPRVAVAPRPSPALDARVEIDALRMGGSLPMSQVRHAIARVESEYEQCYRSAARRAGRDGTGAVAVRFTIDEMGMTRRPTAAGGPLPGLASCIGDATGHVRPRLRPDTGTVDVSFDVRFTPRPAGGR